MKKVIITYLAILAVVFVFLSFLDRDSDYSIEQRLWKVHKMYSDIEKDPDVVPKATFDRVIGQYKSVIDRYPESNVIRGVYFLLSQTYVLNGRFDLARDTLNIVMDKYSGNKEMIADAMSRIGRTYELQDDWDEALRIYQNIIDEYPLSSVGIATPIYIANYYRRKNDFQNTMQSYDEAIVFYKEISKKHSKTIVGFGAARYLANCYLDQSRWADAINVLGDILFVYSDTEFLNAKVADEMIKTINMIAAFQIKDFKVATSLYQEFINKSPDHPLSKYLTRIIDAFNKLEAEKQKSQAAS